MIKLFFSRNSLISRLVWTVLFSLLALTLLIGGWGRHLVLDDVLEKGIDQQNVLNRRATEQLDQALVQRQDKLQQLAHLLVGDDGVLKPEADIQQLLNSRIWLRDAFNGGLLLVDAGGQVQQATPGAQGHIGLSVAGRQYFQSVRANLTALVSQPFTDRISGQPAYMVSVPVVTGSGRFLGLLTGMTLLKGDTALRQVVGNFLPENGHIYIIDLDDELIITSTRPGLETSPLDRLEYSGVIPALLAGDMSGVTRSQYGGQVLYSAAIMQQTGWGVVNTYSYSHWLVNSQDLLAQLFWLALGAMLLIGLLTLPVIRRLLLPIQSISEQLNRMSAKGQQPTHLKVTRNDEFSDLVVAFNQLLDQVREKEMQLTQARELAEEASRSKTQFLANVSHEIKTPLNAVMSLSYIQLEHTFDYDGRLRLQKIQRSGRELLGLINDIFSFIELESNSVRVSRSSFNIEAALIDLMAEYADIANDKSLELYFRLQDEIPPELIGDNRHLFQVLHNLLSNALKFTDKGYVGVEVSLHDRRDDQLQLEFAVHDSGPGIPAEKLNQLFTAFRQLDDSNSRNFGGIGMGLAISNKLVHLMDGGDIRVSTEVGRGSSFSFCIPLQVQGEQALAPDRPALKNARVLVIDRHLQSVQLLTDWLAQWQFTVCHSTDPEAATGLLEQAAADGDAYDLVFLEWSCVQGRPEQLARLEQQLKASEPEGLLLVMAQGREIDDDTLLQPGNYPLLSKPFGRSQVFNAVNQAYYQQRSIITRLSPEQSRVLVVDDNTLNREVVAALLQRYGIPCDLAEDGQKAVEYVRQQSYTLVLMDLQMPVMDGYEATRRIREMAPALPVIAVTAAALEQDRQQAQDAGMNAFLAKPIDQPLFYQQIGRYIQLDQPMAPVSKPGDGEAHALVHRNELNGEKRRQRILIVDDEVANLKILAHTLSQHYVVQLANNGRRAIELCESAQPPDLVLLDIQMPDMDGYEVCQHLKNNNATNRIPVIFVTALSEPESEEKGLRMGAVDYIAKPYQMAVVQARVRTHINLKQKTDLLEELSYLDGLTHIANRRHFDIMLDNELNRLQRGHLSLGLIMLDIDFFKPYNDNYGHGKGDECLQQVAAALDRVIERPSDLLARYGGEEFVVVLPEVDATGVMAVAERLRQAVNELQLPHEYSGVAGHITISLGCIARQVRRSTKAESLLKKADDALYQAKKQGRNRAVLAEESPVPTGHSGDQAVSA